MVAPKTSELDCSSHPDSELYRWAKIRFFKEGEFTQDPAVFDPVEGGISCFCASYAGMSPEEAKRRAPHSDKRKPGILQLISGQALDIDGIDRIEHTPSDIGDEHVDIRGSFDDITTLQSIQLDLLEISTLVLKPGSI